jgi:L-fuconolactonase
MSSLLDRRRFLTVTTNALTSATLVGLDTRALATQARQAADAPESALIDTHTHFYDPKRPEGVPWPPADDRLLYRTVMPKDYCALPVPRAVTGTVVVEASPWVEDNQWVLDLAANEPFIVGLVGNLPVGSDAFAGHLKRFAGNPKFRGLRLRDRPLGGLTEDPAVRRDLKLLVDHDWSLDLVGGSEILVCADRLAEALPKLRIVIDHLAGVRVDGQAPPLEWRQQMQRLGRRKNVYFKVSGLVEGTGRTDGSAPRDVEFYRPVLDAVREMFGVERLLYGSNWPVSERFAPLATVQGIAADYFRSHGRKAEEQVFSLTAGSAYRLAPPTKAGA